MVVESARQALTLSFPYSCPTPATHLSPLLSLLLSYSPFLTCLPTVCLSVSITFPLSCFPGNFLVAELGRALLEALRPPSKVCHPSSSIFTLSCCGPSHRNLGCWVKMRSCIPASFSRLITERPWHPPSSNDGATPPCQ